MLKLLLFKLFVFISQFNVIVVFGVVLINIKLLEILS